MLATGPADIDDGGLSDEELLTAGVTHPWCEANQFTEALGLNNRTGSGEDAHQERTRDSDFDNASPRHYTVSDFGTLGLRISPVIFAASTGSAVTPIRTPIPHCKD